MPASSSAPDLIAQLPLAMAADAHVLARRIERARRGHASAPEWETIAAAVGRSIERRAARAARRPVDLRIPPICRSRSARTRSRQRFATIPW